MKKDNIDLDYLIAIYSEMDQSDLQDEIDQLSDYFYAILEATGSKDILIDFDNNKSIKIELLTNEDNVH